MNDAHEAVDSAINELDRLRRTLKKKTSRQVTSNDEKDVIKATSLAWFNNHLPLVVMALGDDFVIEVNEKYKNLLEYSDRSTARTKYDQELKSLKKYLSELRRNSIGPSTQTTNIDTSDKAPDLTPLISDVSMQAILNDRWNECVKCIEANAPLSATVMMGGLLETILLARFNRETNKDNIFKSKKVPTDKQTNKPSPMNKWTLRNYIDVAHDLDWITASAKDVGEVLRDYRNYVHPYKQYSHGINLEVHDARLFWEISKNITRQIIEKID